MRAAAQYHLEKAKKKYHNFVKSRVYFVFSFTAPQLTISNH